MSANSQPDQFALAYLAGFVDADGYITIHRSERKGVAYFAAALGMSGTRREPLDLAASFWGGNVRLYEPPNPRHRPIFQWQLMGDKAYDPILLLIPHLRIKEPQAWLALEAQELVWDGRGHDPHPWFVPEFDARPRLEEMRAEMKDVLNQWRRGEYPAGVSGQGANIGT